MRLGRCFIIVVNLGLILVRKSIFFDLLPTRKTRDLNDVFSSGFYRLMMGCIAIAKPNQTIRCDLDNELEGPLSLSSPFSSPTYSLLVNLNRSDLFHPSASSLRHQRRRSNGLDSRRSVKN